eukprot:767561-Hanusia_phi.AAC.5
MLLQLQSSQFLPRDELLVDKLKKRSRLQSLSEDDLLECQFDGVVETLRRQVGRLRGRRLTPCQGQHPLHQPSDLQQ